MKLTILVPVYNEKSAISVTIRQIQKVMSGSSIKYEIITVDDGSIDGTEKILKGIKGIKTVTHPYNLGYGSSLKTGLRHAKGEWILITDADGTYPIKDIPKLLRYRHQYDMVVGARTKKGVKIPLSRRPAKWIIGGLASFLTGKKIPDLNSGFRLFRKDMAMEFYHLYPQGFSFTTTITLAAFTNNYTTKYVPINYYKRKGKSSIKPSDFIMFLALIFRIVMYFKPLKFFITPGLLLITLGVFWGIGQFITSDNIAQVPPLLILTGIQICFLGLLADLIIKSRK
ncbi:glycosyltransferase family 2 protein [Candidatus Woesearchaeota archaeon]|nr:glycosyltransferase family 2 protein [Candidatus Woesearchaeota archaeon]